MSNDPEYMRRYMLERYHHRRSEAIIRLGGRCAVCGSTDELELDHVDPRTKSFNLARGHSVSQQRWDAEVAKCQVLCHPHHREKTSREQAADRQQHGTVSRYEAGCKCEPCKEAKRQKRKRLAGLA